MRPECGREQGERAAAEAAHEPAAPRRHHHAEEIHDEDRAERPGRKRIGRRREMEAHIGEERHEGEQDREADAERHDDARILEVAQHRAERAASPREATNRRSGGRLRAAMMAPASAIPASSR